MRNFEKVYNNVYMYQGFQKDCPENTTKAYATAMEHGFAVTIDVRQLADETFICFTDKYMKTLLDTPGVIAKQTYEEIKDLKVLGTDFNVPKLEKVLQLINGRVNILIDLHGSINIKKLFKLMDKYKGEYIIRTDDIFKYFKLKKKLNNVILKYNVFNKKIQLIKTSDYKKFKNVHLDDLIVEAGDNAKTIIKKLFYCFNRYNTRIKEDHFLLKQKIQHRGIIDSSMEEHSRENFERCIQKNRAIEIDITTYKDKLVCYHDDSLPSIMGQKKSISSKNDIDKALTLREALSIIAGKVPVVIDLKDFRFFNKHLVDSVMKQLENYKGDYAIQSFNPLLIRYLYKTYNNVIRGQIGHSLNGFKKLRKLLLSVINFCLFYTGKPDYLVYDLDPTVNLLAKFNNIIGLPIIGYTVVTKEDIEKYSRYFDNFIIEGEIEDT